MVTPMVLYFRSLTVAVPRGFIYKYMPRNWSGSICIGDNSTGRGIYPVQLVVCRTPAMNRPQSRQLAPWLKRIPLQLWTMLHAIEFFNLHSIRF